MRVGILVAALLAVVGGSVLAVAPASAGIPSTPTTLTVGANPVGVTVNPAGTKAYVTISSSTQVDVVDVATGTALAPITACSGPMGIAFTPDGTKAFVPCYNTGTVAEIDPVTGTTVKSITVGTAPFFIAMSPDGSKAYVPNSGGPANTVSVIDTATGTVTATITVGIAPVAVAFNPSGTTAYVANSAVSGGNTVSVINVATSTVTATITVAGVPYGLAVSPDGANLWVSRDNGKKVSVINTTTRAITTTFNTVGQPEGVTFSPDGRRVYVPMQTNGVAVFDTASLTQLTPIVTGTGSRIMAFTPDGTVAYVTNNGSSSISIIAFDNALPTISGTPPAGITGTPYTFTPTVTGQAVTVTLHAGPLPPGLSLVGGVVSGTPTTMGSYPVTIRATNDNGSADLAVTISVALPTYSVTFDAAGGSPTPSDETVTSGALATAPSPEPTLAGYAFDGWWNGASQWDFSTDTVTAATALTAHWLLLPTITGASTADGLIGSSFSYTPTVSAVPGYTVTSTVLPAGLVLDAATGAITGTPTGSPGDTPVTLTVTDANGSADLAVTISLALPIYSVTFDAAGGSPTPSDETVVSGDLATVPSPEPTLAGYVLGGWWNGASQWDFSSDTVTAATALTAHWLPLPTINGALTADAPVGASFTYTPTISAVPGYTVTSTVLPAGLVLDSATGAITGIPTGSLGGTTVTLTVTDANGTASLNLAITVTHGAAVSLTVTPSDATPKQGQTITLTVLAFDASGNSWDVSGDVTITSSVPTDLIAGDQITFLHASPHLLTATLGLVSGSVLVQVSSTRLVLPMTGGAPARWILPWGLASIIAGCVLLVFRRRRVRPAA